MDCITGINEEKLRGLSVSEIMKTKGVGHN
eukprot:SAG22_NODE_3756_length_1543_cov_6.406510_1_plen_29_part_10